MWSSVFALGLCKSVSSVLLKYKCRINYGVKVAGRGEIVQDSVVTDTLREEFYSSNTFCTVQIKYIIFWFFHNQPTDSEKLFYWQHIVKLKTYFVFITLCNYLHALLPNTLVYTYRYNLLMTRPLIRWLISHRYLFFSATHREANSQQTQQTRLLQSPEATD